MQRTIYFRKGNWEKISKLAESEGMKVSALINDRWELLSDTSKPEVVTRSVERRLDDIEVKLDTLLEYKDPPFAGTTAEKIPSGGVSDMTEEELLEANKELKKKQVASAELKTSKGPVQVNDKMKSFFNPMPKKRKK